MGTGKEQDACNRCDSLRRRQQPTRQEAGDTEVSSLKQVMRFGFAGSRRRQYGARARVLQVQSLKVGRYDYGLDRPLQKNNQIWRFTDFQSLYFRVLYRCCLGCLSATGQSAPYASSGRVPAGTANQGSRNPPPPRLFPSSTERHSSNTSRSHLPCAGTLPA